MQGAPGAAPPAAGRAPCSRKAARETPCPVIKVCGTRTR